MLVCHQSFYARTDIAREIHYDLHYRYSADVDWCIRIMRESSRRKLPLRNVHAVLTHFLDGGMTTQNHKASLKERFQVMRTPLRPSSHPCSSCLVRDKRGCKR